MNLTQTRNGRGHIVVAATVALLMIGGTLWGQDSQPQGGGDRTTTTMPSQSDLIRALREERQVNVPIPPSTPADSPDEISSESTRSIGGAVFSGQLLPEGTFVVDRPGRIVREGEWWSFVFESADGGGDERPLLLLPNQQVELMEQTSASGTRSVVFMVSGEVTSYHGRNYVLVRKVLLRRDTGNLRQ